MSYRTREVSQFMINTFVASSPHGTISTLGFMFNVLYEFQFTHFRPYLGVGIGHGFHRYNNVGGNVGTTFNTLNQSRGAFAWQAIAGVAVPVTRRIDVTLDYRLFSTLKRSIGGSYTFPGGTGSETIRPRNINHSVMLGLRYTFN